MKDRKIRGKKSSSNPKTINDNIIESKPESDGEQENPPKKLMDMGNSLMKSSTTPKNRVENDNENQTESAEEDNVPFRKLMDRKRPARKASSPQASFKDDNEKELESDDEENTPLKELTDMPSQPKKLRSTKTKVEDDVKSETGADCEDNLPLKKLLEKFTPESNRRHQKSKTEKEKDESEYEVESIVEMREGRRGVKEYRVRWKGWTSEDDTWEKEDNLNCTQLISAFHQKQKSDRKGPARKASSPQASFKDDNEKELESDDEENTPLKELTDMPSQPKKLRSTKTKVEDDVKSETGADCEDNLPLKKLLEKFTPESNRRHQKSKTEKEKDESEYEVESIVEMREGRRGVKEYRVRWKGWTSEDDTWEKEDNLNCTQLISAFHQKQKSEKKSATKSKYKNRKTKQQDPKTVKETESDGQEYEVESIVEMREGRRGVKEYRVRWKGWTSEDDTWEKEDNLDCTQLIFAFHQKQTSGRKSSGRNSTNATPQASDSDTDIENGSETDGKEIPTKKIKHRKRRGRPSTSKAGSKMNLKTK